jgi:hypothetical protein
VLLAFSSAERRLAGIVLVAFIAILLLWPGARD